jgi:hypothetical protein
MATGEALHAKLYERAAREFDTPEVERAVARAMIPVLEIVLRNLRAAAEG